MRKARREAQAALATSALMIEAVDKLTGLVTGLNEEQERFAKQIIGVMTDLNERQGSLVETVGSLTGFMELALIVEGVSLRTLVEVCDQLDRTDLLVKLRDHLEMVNEATADASARRGGPDL